jgi:hypothetical protein
MDVRKIAVVTANLGGFDLIFDYAPQSMEYDFYRFTDENFPPRSRAMTPRMQARIIKCFSWQIVPNYTHYIWVDGSCSLFHKDSVKWFLEQCENADAAFFKHPERNTIQQECDYLKKKLAVQSRYICSRYMGEFLDEQMDEIRRDTSFKDDFLYASTAFVYQNNPCVHDMLKEWWYHISRYHIIDQLALPYVIKKSECKVNIIDEKYGEIPYLTPTRKWHVDKYLHRLS